MSEAGADFWTDDTSVLFTSFWGWRPETWATVGWSNAAGRTRRDGLLNKLSDPFIVVVYVAKDPDGLDRELVGKIAGFMLVSHEKGHRNEFTHPVHHNRHPEKWEHSLRALRAFSYVSDPLLVAKEFEPTVSTGAQAIACWGKILNDPTQIEKLRGTPWLEVPIYRADVPFEVTEDRFASGGMVQAGPIATQQYVVSPEAARLGWRLYILRLQGRTSDYLGRPAEGRFIYKIGLATSPDVRRRNFQKAMPRGAFRWQLHQTSKADRAYGVDAAVIGEYAMKRYLAACSEHLGGEFYLATEHQIEEAWRCGLRAAEGNGEKD